MKKVLSFLWSILEFVIIVYVIVMTSILLSKNKYGFTQFMKEVFKVLRQEIY